MRNFYMYEYKTDQNAVGRNKQRSKTVGTKSCNTVSTTLDFDVGFSFCIR